MRDSRATRLTAVAFAMLAVVHSAGVAAGQAMIDESDVAVPPVDAAHRFDYAARDRDAAVEQLLAEMTLAEKIGQMCQVAPEGAELTPQLCERLHAGEIGSLINVPSAEFAAQAQRIVGAESRLGVPLFIGRDVIHGYRTVFPIPLGQAASWNPELVERAASIAADEARTEGINWTFAPMVDVCRDPRWGRIAETLGEDPALGSELAAAMVRGFQQERDGRLHGVVACAKHFAGYGFAEGGRDYNRASLSDQDLHNVCLPPFHAAADAGCRTFMTTFSEVNGIPGTAHRRLIAGTLRSQWKFPGFVVSDWNSVIEMIEHGYSADEAEAAADAVNAGVDMEMASPTFHDHLATLIEQGAVSEAAVDDAVRRILRVKYELAPAEADGVANRPRRSLLRPQSLATARKLARQSLVLLKNKNGVLPLDPDTLRRVAVIGALADDPSSQLGCWAPDGYADDAVTPLAALREALGESVDVRYAPGASGDFTTDRGGFEQARVAAEQADAVILFVGERAVLSGESHSRADLGLPGVQRELVEVIAAVGKPTVMVVLAGRPLTIGAECEATDAVLYAWHPGTMGGEAIAEVLLGAAAPTGKLPVTLLKSAGQVPLYYGHTNTGRPSPAGYEPLTKTNERDLPMKFQYRSHYLDSDPLPLFPFGFGLSYARFEYSDLGLSATSIARDEELSVSVDVANVGDRAGAEVVQLYIRDLVAQPVRPVRELKAFRRVYLRPGEHKTVAFALDAQELGYVNAKGDPVATPGRFAVWVGGDSSTELGGEFDLVRTGDDPRGAPPAAPVQADRAALSPAGEIAGSR